MGEGIKYAVRALKRSGKIPWMFKAWRLANYKSSIRKGKFCQTVGKEHGTFEDLKEI